MSDLSSKNTTASQRSWLAGLTIFGLMVLGSSGLALIDLTTEPMTVERLVGILRAHPEVTKLDDVPKLMPSEFLSSFILKHGIKREGERGHLVETKVSQSSDPLAPRAIIFDERSGLTISYNGGGENQTANQRLDVMSFDFSTKKFNLEQIDFPIAGGRPEPKSGDCATCHGPNLRPIFAMYPDWPSFYASDNDELTGSSAVQKKEAADYRRFLTEIVPHHPRYAPLFSSGRVAKFLGRKIYPTYPYRPDSSEKVRDVSRSFSFRPGLRIGLVYNRLLKESLMAQLKAHARYGEFAPYFMFNLLQCSWPAALDAKRDQWLSKVGTIIGEKPHTLEGGLLDYRQNWAIFDLKLNDVDLRYSYNHAGFANQDATHKVMEVGYIGRYFNAYFDGSATIDELMAAALYTDLSVPHPSLKGLTEPWGLVAKYRHLEDRFKLDRSFFEQMDRLGKWIEMPYPKELSAVHHRESFTPAFAADHAKLCTALQKML